MQRFGVPALRFLWGVFAGAFVIMLPFGLLVAPAIPVLPGLTLPPLGILSALVLPPDAASARKAFICASLAYALLAGLVLAGMVSRVELPRVLLGAATILLLLLPIPSAGLAVWRLGKYSPS